MENHWMTFPVVFHIFSYPVPAHAVFELAAYLVGVQTYLILRRNNPPLNQSPETTLWLIVFCVFGALIGSKILAHLEMSPDELAQIHDWRGWFGGKTIVGGLLGGWLAVEIGKKFFGITVRTGDAYVLPLALGIAIGRVGCFLTGLPDHTYGIATSLPWGVDFGDGISRHPTQIYEIVFVLMWGTLSILMLRTKISPSSGTPGEGRGGGAFQSQIENEKSQIPSPHPDPPPEYRRREIDGAPAKPGELFRLFMLGYFLFRLCVEFIKPVYRGHLGLSMIQCASIIGAIWAAYGLLPATASVAKEQPA